MIVGVVVALGTVAAVDASPQANSATAQSTPSSGNIQIIQTPSGGGSPICLPPALALRQRVRSDGDTFRLTITVTNKLCFRVDAVAVIYGMPGNGVAWPQQLKETAPFSLRDPGVTEVIFTKTCDPVQFDVITGATPQTIAPWGQWHGPLLFPLDMSTSLQWWGCVPPSSTTTTTTTSSTTTTTIDDNCEDYTPDNVAVSTSVAAPGQTLVVSGTGTPGTSIQVLLRPPPDAGGLSAAEQAAGFVALSDIALVQPDGTWQATVIVPLDAQPGTWVVAAHALGCDTEVTTEITVTGDPVTGEAAQPPAAPPTGDPTNASPPSEGPVVAGESVVRDVPEAAVSSTPAAPTPATGTGTADAAPQVAGLAFTGTSTHIPVAAGIVLLTLGGLLLLGKRRREP